MKAFVLRDHGTAPSVEDIAAPEPGEGEILLAVEACGLNFADLLMLQGRYQDTPPPPFVPGLEMAGRVAALGPGVAGPAPGTRVAAFAGSGGLSERAVVPADRCILLPDTMPTQVAAGFMIAYGTSHLALSHLARVGAGDRLAILGAAGGVGLTAVELGARMGAEVIAVARGEGKLAVARRAGAAHGIDAEAPDLKDRLRALGGVDVLYDAVGGDAFDAAFRAMRPGGRVLIVGFASGRVPEVKLNHLLVKNVTLHGLYWGGYPRFAPEVMTASLAELMAMHGRGELRPHVSHVLPLDRVAEGLDLIRTRRSTGKVVVTL
jgi:NADPH2:quinone reductase